MSLALQFSFHIEAVSALSSCKHMLDLHELPSPHHYFLNFHYEILHFYNADLLILPTSKNTVFQVQVVSNSL